MDVLVITAIVTIVLTLSLATLFPACIVAVSLADQTFIANVLTDPDWTRFAWTVGGCLIIAFVSYIISGVSILCIIHRIDRTHHFV